MESKNTYWAHRRGEWAEAKVRDYYLQKYPDLRLQAQRLKTPYAEIDLLFINRKNELMMVEVKTLSSDSFITHRVTRRQKQRLAQAHTFLQEKYKTSVEIHWAYVEKNGEVLVFDEIF